jgi:hypothetical protein
LETDLPDYHAATVTHRDSQGESYRSEAVLDWRMVNNRDIVTVLSTPRS